MKIKFTKMQGLGNDFMVIDALTQAVNLDKATILKLADRHFGVGFDQCLLVEKPKDLKADFYYRIFNADGCEVEQCGNGARCILHFLLDQNLTTKKQLCLATRGDYLIAKLNSDSTVSVTMGKPIFKPSLIPFLASKQQTSYTLEIASQVITFCALNMGNPHAVIVCQDINDEPVAATATALQKHCVFPQGVNVGFMQILDATQIRLRVYERGAGETLACGSGACAAVVAGQLVAGLAGQVNVSLPGGELTIQWRGGDHPVVMTGPVARVFEGYIEV